MRDEELLPLLEQGGIALGTGGNHLLVHLVAFAGQASRQRAKRRRNERLGGTRGIPLDWFVHNRAGSADIVMYYVIFGICWIFISDLLLS